MNETNVKTVTECDAKVIVRTEEKIPTRVIRNKEIAKRLCVDYPFWDDLLSIRKDRDDPQGKLHVWIFKESKEFNEAFLEIVEDRKRERESRMKELAE